MSNWYHNKQLGNKLCASLILALSVSGCVDLSGSRNTYSKKKIHNTAAFKFRATLI